jgi:hypothetical protein
MGLLEEVLEAAGGVERWRRLDRYTMHISIEGSLLERKSKGGLLRELVVEGSTREPSLQLTGFLAPDRRGLYHPRRVAIERADGTLIEERQDPLSAFAGHTEETPWDDLDLVYFCGTFCWQAIVSPFVFAEPDVRVDTAQRPKPRNGHDKRCLRIKLPARFAAFSAEETIQYDRSALAQRIEYEASFPTGRRLIEDLSAHQTFSGIVIPTLRRGRFVGDGEPPRRRHAALDIEIFDAAFA